MGTELFAAWVQIGLGLFGILAFLAAAFVVVGEMKEAKKQNHREHETMFSKLDNHAEVLGKHGERLAGVERGLDDHLKAEVLQQSSIDELATSCKELGKKVVK